MKLIRLSENLYETDVAVNVHLNLDDDSDYSMRHKTRVRFSIDMIYRNWGIASAYVSIRSIDPVRVDLYDQENGNIVREIVIPPDVHSLSREKKRGDMLGVGNIDLYCQVKGGDVDINYETSEIEVYEL